MRVLVSGVFSGWVLGPGQYAGARGGSGSLGVGALVRGGGFCDLGTATIYNPSRLTDDRKLLTDTSSSAPDKCTTITYHTLYTTIHRSPPRNPEHTGVALSYAPPVMSGGVRAIRVCVPGPMYRVVLGCGSR